MNKNVVQVMYAEDENAKWHTCLVPDNIQVRKDNVVLVVDQNENKHVSVCTSDSEFVSDNILNMIMSGGAVANNLIGVYELKTDLDFDYENIPGYDCEFVIKASGSQDKCNAFFETLKDICPTTVMTDEKYEDEYIMFLEGDCRWSVEANFINNLATWDIFRQFSNELFIQAFARNPGEGFREHYIYKDGVCLHKSTCEYTDNQSWVYFD